MKKLLYLVLILIIFGLGYLKWQSWQSPVIPVVTSSPTPTPAPVVSDDQTLETTYFSLSYPKVATSSPVSESPDSTSWTIRYMGQKQVESGRTQTELFDGYAITFTVFPSVVGDDPALTQAESDRDGSRNGCTDSSVAPIRETELAGKKAYTFTGGCIADSTSFYFIAGDSLYRISTMAVGEPGVVTIYQQAIDKIITSFKII